MPDPIATQPIAAAAASPAPAPSATDAGKVIANDPITESEIIAALPVFPLPANLGQNLDTQV